MQSIDFSDGKQCLHIVHVVRRYGPVGGMERYVWELTLQLARLGHQVTVICERCHVDQPAGISVIELGEVAPRPGWVAALRFSHRVAIWLHNHQQSDWIIHSHERIHSHHITTFHGSVFATVFEKPWWKLLSIRIAIRLFIERRELEVPQIIVPNSQRIKVQLAHYYPTVANKLVLPVTPGVASTKQREFSKVPSGGGVIGFVGLEWKRKGLPLAISIVKKLQLTRPNLTFVVVGPGKESVSFLFADWQSGYVLKDWNGHVDYAQFDVLLHPAKSEPYGMVISEAMSARVPVVVSDVCGACDDISPTAGSNLPLSSSIDAWVNALEIQLSRTEPVPQFSRDWADVAQDYVLLYQTLRIPAKTAVSLTDSKTPPVPTLKSS